MSNILIFSPLKLYFDINNELEWLHFCLLQHNLPQLILNEVQFLKKKEKKRKKRKMRGEEEIFWCKVEIKNLCVCVCVCVCVRVVLVFSLWMSTKLLCVYLQTNMTKIARRMQWSPSICVLRKKTRT